MRGTQPPSASSPPAGGRSKRLIAEHFIAEHQVAGKANRPGRALGRLFTAGFPAPGQGALRHFSENHPGFMRKHNDIARALGIPQTAKPSPPGAGANGVTRLGVDRTPHEGAGTGAGTRRERRVFRKLS